MFFPGAHSSSFFSYFFLSPVAALCYPPLAPSSAYRRVLDHFDSNNDAIADRFFVPDYKWVFNFHAKYIKDKFGSSNGIDVFLKVKENITKYNTERGGEFAKVTQTTGGETIIAICDLFNMRVH